jgi:hypothetical protein
MELGKWLNNSEKTEKIPEMEGRKAAENWKGAGKIKQREGRMMKREWEFGESAKAKSREKREEFQSSACFTSSLPSQASAPTMFLLLLPWP